MTVHPFPFPILDLFGECFFIYGLAGCRLFIKVSKELLPAWFIVSFDQTGPLLPGIIMNATIFVAPGSDGFACFLFKQLFFFFIPAITFGIVDPFAQQKVFAGCQ